MKLGFSVDCCRCHLTIWMVAFLIALLSIGANHSKHHGCSLLHENDEKKYETLQHTIHSFLQWKDKNASCRGLDISRCRDDNLASDMKSNGGAEERETKIFDLCNHLNITSRYLCCKSDYYRILHNVVVNPSIIHGNMDTFQPIKTDVLQKLPFPCSPSQPRTSRQSHNQSVIEQYREKRFVMYQPRPTHPMVSSTNFHQETHQLPAIRFEAKMMKNSVQLPLITKWTIDFPEAFPRDIHTGILPSDCKSFYNGTLHVIGKHHPQNLFHFVNDNLLPLASQIVLDAYTDPEYLTLPRAHLVVGTSTMVSMSGELPHMEFIEKDLLPDEFTLKSLDNVCFRRVVYGTGSRLIYHHVLRRLRQESSEFLHLLAKQKYCRYATTTTSSSPTSEYIPDSSHIQRICERKTFGRLKVVIYSRGSSGHGRSLANEVLLQRRLQSVGFDVEISRSSQPFMQQLEQVLSADVMVGLHGAGLTNAIFARAGVGMIELKGHYGFDLDLFALVSEARWGKYLQLDIRKYARKGNGGGSGGGSGTIDDALVDRIIGGIRILNGQNNVTRSVGISNLPIQRVKVINQSPLDVAILPVEVEQGLIPNAHTKNFVSKDMLGPTLDLLGTACRDLVYLEYWQLLGAKYKDRHCQGCSKH